MRIAVIADTFAPSKSSAAIMLQDLVKTFSENNHFITVIVPDSKIEIDLLKTKKDNIEIIRVLTPQLKNNNHIKRAFVELFMPFYIYRRLLKYKLVKDRYDAIVWYSPSIFFGPLIYFLKKKNSCKTYLILRDIFPKWARDMGLIRKGLPYYFLKLVEYFQYSVADTIGYQSVSNFEYLKKFEKKDKCKIELLRNWLTYNNEQSTCSIMINKTHLAGKKIFIYTGNIGIAQGVEKFIDTIFQISLLRDDIGFVFVGRGDELNNVINKCNKLNLKNVIFFDEIPNNEIPKLYEQCNYGLVLLDPMHTTQNIPGKFISYITYGIPVFACLNKGNDLIDIINNHYVGHAIQDMDVNKTTNELINFVKKSENINDNRGIEISSNCYNLSKDLFSTHRAADQIIKSFSL